MSQLPPNNQHGEQRPPARTDRYGVPGVGPQTNQPRPAAQPSNQPHPATPQQSGSRAGAQPSQSRFQPPTQALPPNQPARPQTPGNQPSPPRPAQQPAQANRVPGVPSPNPAARVPAANPSRMTASTSSDAGRTPAWSAQSSSARAGTTRAYPAATGQSPYPASATYPAEYPASQSTATQSRKQRKRRGGRAAIVVLSILLPLGIIGGAFAGYAAATNFNAFDNKAVEDSVAQVLRDEYGFSDLTSVDCPNWIRVEQGDAFQCEFEYAGGTQTVTVTQGSQSGQLVVGAPDSEQ